MHKFENIVSLGMNCSIKSYCNSLHDDTVKIVYGPFDNTVSSEIECVYLMIKNDFKDFFNFTSLINNVPNNVYNIYFCHHYNYPISEFIQSFTRKINRVKETLSGNITLYIRYDFEEKFKQDIKWYILLSELLYEKNKCNEFLIITENEKNDYVEQFDHMKHISLKKDKLETPEENFNKFVKIIKNEL